MKEVVVYEGPRTELIESPVPKATAGQVVIKVNVSGSNPKDWKTQWVADLPINMGDDIAGIIHEVGPDATGFKVCAPSPMLASQSRNPKRPPEGLRRNSAPNL